MIPLHPSDAFPFLGMLSLYQVGYLHGSCFGVRAYLRTLGRHALYGIAIAVVITSTGLVVAGFIMSGLPLVSRLNIVPEAPSNNMITCKLMLVIAGISPIAADTAISPAKLLVTFHKMGSNTAINAAKTGELTLLA